MRVKRTFLVVILILVACTALPWLLLLRGDADKVGGNPLFPWAVAFFCLVPIYPLYAFAKQWPPFRVGISIIALNLFLSIILAVLHYAFQLDNIWIDRAFDVSNIFFFSGCLLLAWQGLRLHRR